MIAKSKLDSHFKRAGMTFFLIIFGFASHLQAAPLKIAATILPISDIVKSIAGPETEVVTLLPPGANPHIFELTPQLIKKLDGSVIIFRIGKGFDDWITGVFDNLPASQLIQLDQGIQLINHDPHYWLSIRNAKIMARTIADKLIETDSSNKVQYETNLKHYLEELDQADQYIKDELSNLPNKKIITFHDGWRYLVRDHGLEVVATVESSEGSEPTPKRLAKLHKIVRDHQIQVLFTEPAVPQSLAESIAHNFNLRLVQLDPLGSEKENQTFIKLMLHNADKIEEALT